MASAHTLKRGHAALSEGVPAPPSARPASKRRCRAAATLDGALRSTDAAGPARYAARRAALAPTPDAVFSRLLAGLGGDARALLRIVDANVAAEGVGRVLADARARGAGLAAIGVRTHAFVMGEKDGVLAAYAGFYSGEAWARDVATFVAREVFCGERCVEITVLSGGGVRDVLLADFCRMYGIVAGAAPPPHLVVVTGGGSGRSFLIPYVPGAEHQR
jgi:hypothetical protein